MEDRGSNAVTLVVVVGCGSCMDVVVASDVVCIADTSGMLGHRVFTSCTRALCIDALSFPQHLCAAVSCPLPQVWKRREQGRHAAMA